MGLALCDGRKTLSFFLAGGQLSAPVQLVLDRWVDLAVSVEKDGKAALYVDGAAVGSGTLPGAALPAALMLGNAQSAGGTLRDGLAGVMDSAALFSVALDAERLRSCAEDGLTVFTPSLEALWLFSEGGWNRAETWRCAGLQRRRGDRGLPEHRTGQGTAGIDARPARSSRETG